MYSIFKSIVHWYFSRCRNRKLYCFLIDFDEQLILFTQLKMRISTTSFQRFTIFNKNDWFFLQIFKTFRFFVKIRIVIAQWRHIWMSIHIWIFVWFEQFNSTISFVFSATKNLLNYRENFNSLSFFLFCLSFFYFKI